MHFFKKVQLNFSSSKVKIRILHPIQQPGSYWDKPSALPLVGNRPTEVKMYIKISLFCRSFHQSDRDSNLAEISNACSI